MELDNQKDICMNLTCLCVRVFVLSSMCPTLQLDYKNVRKINKFESFCLYACDIAICSPSCQHGRCTSPNNCTCNSGWTGRDCSQRECNIPCPSFVTRMANCYVAAKSTATGSFDMLSIYSLDSKRFFPES